MKTIINSPSKYIQGNGELANLNNYASSLGEKGVYAIVDPFVLEHFSNKIKDPFNGDKLKLTTWKFNGESSQKEIDAIVAGLKGSGCDVVAGIGGGKTLDTAKAVAYYAKLPVVIVPTIASSDAPCSALSVIYKEDGEFERYLILPQNPEVVLVDTSIIVHAPARLFVAGMGDALATYFEARACHSSHSATMAGGVCSNAALALARQCLVTLYEDGLKAKIAVENKTISQAVENVIEANTYLSGIGFESGGLAAAHAIHNGLTVLEDTHEGYHGEKVSFGTIVQLVLENASLEEIEEVVAFCKSVGLPTNLHDIGVKKITEDKIRQVAEASCAEGETIHNMPVKITVESVIRAIYVANELGTK